MDVYRDSCIFAYTKSPYADTVPPYGDTVRTYGDTVRTYGDTVRPFGDTVRRFQVGEERLSYSDKLKKTRFYGHKRTKK